MTKDGELVTAKQLWLAVQAASKGTWGRARCSASKRGSSPPEQELLRDLEPVLWGTGSTAALHQYVYMNDVPMAPGGF